MGLKDKSPRNAKHIVFGGRNTVETFGVKITSAQREYYRYTGVSAEVERHGTGSNLRDFVRIPRGERDQHRPH
ncbi:MAG: hypothetical protein WA252_07280 [Candidatus Sulfotelmatobacter sp.]